MLTALHIQDFVLIKSLALSLDQGLTALTGETGAGKSILLDALGLAAGARAGRGGVRRGAEKGVVTAVFEPNGDHPVWSLLEENDLPADDDQVILRRVQMKDGRGRAFINDQPASIAMLRKIGGALIEIHGQHDGRGFLTASTHRSVLDEFAGLSGETLELGRQWTSLREVENERDERRAAREHSIREADYLRHVVEELGSLSPEENEENALAERRSELIAAEKVAEDLRAIQAKLADDAFENDLASCARRLAKAAAAFETAENPLDDALQKIDGVLSDLMEAKASVEDASSRLDHDPNALDAVEERLFALRAAARKHGVPVQKLPEVLTNAKASLELVEQDASDLADLGKRVEELQRDYEKAAVKLSGKRIKAAQALDNAVARELKPLKLGAAQFETSIKTDPENPGQEGINTVEFMVATNPGAPAGPLKTIASGGELSRFILAMKAALAAKENRTVIIFDEVDAGVGGAVADAVGERLGRLGADAQVLVVTHSPQVAARAERHWVVEKEQGTDETVTSVRILKADERVDEVARMLAGAEITSEARAAAARLLGAPVGRPQSGKKKSVRTAKTPGAKPRRKKTA